MLLEHLQILVSSRKGFETNPPKNPVNSYECVNISIEHEYTHKHASRFSQSVSTETIFLSHEGKICTKNWKHQGCTAWLSWKRACLESIRTRVQDPRKKVKKSGMVAHTCSPALERQWRGDPWGFEASQSSVISEPQDRETPFPRRKMVLLRTTPQVFQNTSTLESIDYNKP